MLDLSIVIPTCNRSESLTSCLVSVRNTVQCQYELIVVDGASSDATPEVLRRAQETFGNRLTVIHEPQREGFVKAANKGFRAARGRYVTWLNDDALPLDHALDRALEQIAFSPRTVGMVAMFHSAKTGRNIALEAHHKGRAFCLLHVRGTLYANFGIAARTLWERLGYFDERYFLNGADPDFSLKVWNTGLSVVPAFGALIDHQELEDPRRQTDLARADEDNAKLFAKWNLPDKKVTSTFDFDQTRPCTLRGLRTARAA
jgi:GT2 family glycosyltransferase